MEKAHSYPCIKPLILFITLALYFSAFLSFAQDVGSDEKSFRVYKKNYFKPRKRLQYNIFLSPVMTVDPLGTGGKSTYAIGAGTRINLWESKSIGNSLQGLRVKGIYTGFGYEYYPKQFDNIYASLWMRIKTFMPIVARLDGIYSYGNGLSGLSTRYCFGFEVSRITVLLSGTITFYGKSLSLHPHDDSPYTNVGGVMLVIPFFNRYPPVK